MKRKEYINASTPMALASRARGRCEGKTTSSESLPTSASQIASTATAVAELGQSQSPLTFVSLTSMLSHTNPSLQAFAIPQASMRGRSGRQLDSLRTSLRLHHATCTAAVVNAWKFGHVLWHTAQWMLYTDVLYTTHHSSRADAAR